MAEEGLKFGKVCLLRAQGDYDKAERRRRSGRIDTVARLAAANIRIRVRFPVPLRSLGRRGQLLFSHPSRESCCGVWLVGPGIDPAQPVDVVAAALADDSRLLADLVLPELGCHKLARDPNWGELSRAYSVACAVRACCDGLWCDAVIDLEAY